MVVNMFAFNFVEALKCALIRFHHFTVTQFICFNCKIKIKRLTRAVYLYFISPIQSSPLLSAKRFLFDLYVDYISIHSDKFQPIPSIILHDSTACLHSKRGDSAWNIIARNIFSFFLSPLNAGNEHLIESCASFYASMGWFN